MSTRLRDAAIRHLHSLGNEQGEGAVKRLTMDVEVDGRVEMVTLSLRDGRLRCVSTDAENDGPHVLAALRFVAGLEQREDSSPPGPLASMPEHADQGAEHELAEALDDLLTAITRVGADKAQYAPSVDAALERLMEAAPQPAPPGLSRFIGRLQSALRATDAQRVARLLLGASKLAQALRENGGSADTSARLNAWLGVRPGSMPDVELVYDRTMIELGREWLSGTERAGIERRYLVDLGSGITFREDRPRSATASLGPCPRLVQVGLAEVERGPAPRRIRVLQYEVSLDVSPQSWERLRQVASRSFTELSERYRSSISDHPSLSEPFALIAPYRIERNGVFKAFDSDGHQLLLDRQERRGAVLAFYDMLAEGLEPAWLAGRLTDDGSAVSLIPFSVGARDGTFTRL